MRGFETQQTAMFSYISLDERVPSDHPLPHMQILFTVRSERQLME